jgi:hypothetical protein
VIDGDAEQHRRRQRAEHCHRDQAEHERLAALTSETRDHEVGVEVVVVAGVVVAGVVVAGVVVAGAAAGAAAAGGLALTGFGAAVVSRISSIT